MEAWYNTAFEIEEALSGECHHHVHLLVADVVKSFDTTDRGIIGLVLGRLGLPPSLNIMPMCDCVSRSRVAWEPRAPEMRPSLIGALSMAFTVLCFPWCRYLEVGSWGYAAAVW